MAVGTVALLLCADIITLHFSLAKCRCFDFPQFSCAPSNLSACVCVRVLLFIIFNEASLIMQLGLCHWSPRVLTDTLLICSVAQQISKGQSGVFTPIVVFKDFQSSEEAKTKEGFGREGGGKSLWPDWDGITLSVKLIDFLLCFFSWWSSIYVDVSSV